MKFVFKNFGFTLAEVLITLGIIGIIAAMTIPPLITNQRNKKFESNIKKVYSELNQVSKLYLNDNEETIPFALSANHTDLKTILLTYVKGITVINSDKWDSTEDDGSSSAYVYNRYTNFKGTKVKQICDDYGTHGTLGGISLAWNNNPVMGDNGPIICVDLNAEDKPNVVGIDYFLFIFTNDGTLIPMGMEHPQNSTSGNLAVNFFLSKDYCGANTNNYSCAYWAILDKNPNGAGTYWRDYLGKKLYK